MSEPEFSRIANAKINLALHVTGQRNDGYHLLDTLVCFVDSGDRLKVSFAPTGSKQVSLKITGPFAGGLGNSADNLIIKAANAMLAILQKANIACPPVNIHLEKNLPVASGIGGGSADAAAALLLLSEIWAPNRNIDLNKLALDLGADVPMCLDNEPKRAQGIGEMISPFALECALPIVLVNPGNGVSTPDIFGALQNKWNGPIETDNLGSLETIEQTVDFIAPLNNDLAAPAILLVPQIKHVLTAIKSRHGCLLSRMSGSGATCFGIFGNDQSAAVAVTNIKDKHPHWWCVSAKTVSSKESHHDKK